MSWIQQNKVPAAIMGLSAAGAAGLGFMMFQSWQEHSSALEQFDNLNRGIQGLNSAVLAPTPQNLELKKGLVGELTTEAGKLSTVLTRLQGDVKPEAISDTGFQAKLKTRIAEVRNLAAGRMALPAEFNLAFDRYNSELPKSNDEATELSGYLDAVESIVKSMVQSGVAQLDMISRSDLPPEKSPAPAPKSKGGQPAPAAPQLVKRQTVTAVITTDQAALQILLSKLASPSEMPYFTVVRLVRIENERKEGPLRADVGLHTITPPEGTEAADNAALIAVAPPVPAPGGANPPEKDDTIAAVQPMNQDAVDVLGKEALKAYLEIDIISFQTTASAAPGR